MCAKSQLTAQPPTTKFWSNLFHAIGKLFYSVAKFASGTVSVHQQLFHCTELTGRLYNRDGVCLLRGTDWVLYIIQVMCFVWIWEQTAIISLYSINWLGCITETESVYCAVRTECLTIIQVSLVFKG